MAKSLTDIYVGVNKADSNRKNNDLYRTPPIATYILEKYSNIPKCVVEPCAGYGNISAELIRHGHHVKSYDLHAYKQSIVNIDTGIDVMTLEKPAGYTGLITNPPYHKNLPMKIALKALEEYDYVALLVRLTYLEGKRRKPLFDAYPPNQLIFFSDRIRFDNAHIEPIEKKDQIGGMIAYAWVIWDSPEQAKNTILTWALMEKEYDEWRQHYERNKK